jgi:uncharacterized protein
MDKIPASIEMTIRKFIKEAGQSHRIKSAYLYGSYAKGVASKWSDIDIAVILTDFSDDLFEERVSLMRIAAQIDDRIEPYPFLEETFTANNPLVHEIQKHGIRIV